MTTTEFANKRNEYGIEGTGVETVTTEERIWTNKTNNEVELIIPAGSRVKVYFSPRKTPSRIFVWYGNTVKVSLTVNGYKWLRGFKKPAGMKSLERQSYDGIAKSVLGKKVEPDGFDECGSPSWLLVIGVI